MLSQEQTAQTQIQIWSIERLVFYARNPRKNDAAVDRMCASIREFGFKVPVLARSNGEVVDGHLRLKAAKKLGITEVPVILCDEWTPAQVKAFRLMVNRSVTWAQWDEELLTLELQELNEADFDLSLTGFDPKELDDLLVAPEEIERENATPPLPASPVSRLGDLWVCGPHRVLCGDATSAEDVARLLGDRKPALMVTDPPYGISLDSEWRDRAGLNSCGPAEASYMKHRTAGHTETTISGDTRADWSEAFELVPSLQIVYVWHASVFTREVLNGLLRIGFLYPQQIIWNKLRTVLTRTHYWYAHEPCWYLRRVNAPWFGKAGENSTIWDSPSPKFIMGGSDEEKYDHPTQKPVELMRRPILNHLKRHQLVYDPFLGSGTTLAAAELTERACVGIELDPKYVDVVVLRWQTLSGKQAVRCRMWIEPLGDWHCGMWGVVTVCLFVTLARLLIAQAGGTGVLAGKVTDASGASVSDVKVTAVNADNGQTRTITTGADGAYAFGALPPGNYSVKFEARAHGAVGAVTGITGTIPMTLADFKIDAPSLLGMPVRNDVPIKVNMNWHPL